MLFRLAKGHIPVFADFGASFFSDEIMAGRQLFDSFQEAQWCRYVTKRKILFESGVIQTPRNPLYLKNGLQFRSKEKPARFAADKKRFFADAVTPEDQSFEFRIPDREAEHPAKALEKLEAFFFIEMDDDFSVGACAEGMALCFHLVPQRLEVVDLTVENDPDAIVLIADGLVATGDVNDGKPSLAHWTPEDSGNILVSGAARCCPLVAESGMR